MRREWLWPDTGSGPHLSDFSTFRDPLLSETRVHATNSEWVMGFEPTTLCLAWSREGSQDVWGGAEEPA